MMLKDKVAVIYGVGGSIGGAVARAFAGEGAKTFLTGRLRAPVETVAKDIVAAGGSGEVAEVDALDERAVERHLQSVIEKAGRIDVSFNAVGIPDAKILGVPLIELDVEQFALPVASYVTSYFLTARLAARRMIANKSGVIMTVTALHSRTGGMTWEQWQQMLASRTHGRRLMTIAEMSNVAVFMASDKASRMTGTTVNLTMGSLDD
jgi:NAD(P)-dependent dehydrogenase (short-subunit alcohol dehydrogenase family)